MIYVNFTNKPKWFLEVNPEGKVPVINFGDKWIPNSNVIVGLLDPSLIAPPNLPLFGDARSKACEVVDGERIYSICDKPYETFLIYYCLFPLGLQPPTGYDIPYFRPTVDEALRDQGPHEALTSHAANGMPASSIPLVQQVQQHQPIAHMNG